MSLLRVNHPGQVVRFIGRPEPVLTKRQEVVLHTVRAFNGNRSRAARHLGVTVRAVQKSMMYAKEAGVTLPPSPTGRIGRPNIMRAPLGPRCHAAMRSGICGRPLGHPSINHVEEKAWHRKRPVKR